MSSKTYLDGQTPVWRTLNSSQSITIDPINENIVIENTSIPKKIIINPIEFSNGTQVLPYTQLYEKINAVNAAVYPAPNSNTIQVNDTLFLDNGSGSTTTLDVSALTLNGSGIGGPTNTVTQGDMTITDNTATNISQITADYVQFTTPVYNTTLNSYNLNVSDTANSYTANVGTGIITLTDGNGGMSLQLELDTDHTLYAEPQIRFQNQTGQNNYLRYSELNCDSSTCFKFNANNRFFKQINPFSFQVYTANDGDYIEMYYPFVLADNISVLKLYSPSTYLDDSNNAGWSCIVSNCSGVDVQIDTAGYQWYAHSNGLGGGPIILKKWATSRITLLFSTSTVGDYVWAVSQF